MNFKRIKSDHVGIVLSCTCLLHCVALPFVLIAMNFVLDEGVTHTVLFMMALGVTAHAVYHSYKMHCKHIVMFFAFLGLSLLCIDLAIHYFESQAAETQYIQFATPPEHFGHDHSGHNHVDQDMHIEILPILGSLCLMLMHLVRLKSNKTTTCGECNNE